MATKLKSVSVFSPCLNEAKNIPRLVTAFQQHIPRFASEYEFIIINDGSTDDTIKVVKELQQTEPNLRLINHTHNQGYGASLKSGIRAAKNEWIFYTDGDNQFDISQLSKFIPYTSTYNAIIGYRIRRADGRLRALNARIFKLFIDVLFRLRVKDIDCAFKLFKASQLKPIPLTTKGAMISTEMLYRLKKRGVKFHQIPVNHYPRKHGTPTGNHPKVVLKAISESVKLYVGLKIHPDHT